MPARRSSPLPPRGARKLGALLLALLCLAPALARAADPVRLWHAYRDAEQDALVAIIEAHTATTGTKVELLQVAHESFGLSLIHISEPTRPY